MENRVLQTELIAWQELNDLQPKGLKIDTNTAALKTSYDNTLTIKRNGIDVTGEFLDKIK